MNCITPFSTPIITKHNIRKFIFISISFSILVSISVILRNNVIKTGNEKDDIRRLLSIYDKNRYDLIVQRAQQSMISVPIHVLDEVRYWNLDNHTNISESVYDLIVLKSKLPAEYYYILNDMLWTHDLFHEWGTVLLENYYKDIINTIDKDSILFAGTDLSYFGINSLSIVHNNCAFVLISQNRAADQAYLKYINSIYSNMQIPDAADLRNIAYKAHENTVGNIDDILIHATYLTAWKLFELNRDKYVFYVDEGIIMEWMFPFLRPCGLLMKLENKRIDSIGEALVNDDMLFWDIKTKLLLSNNVFYKNKPARLAYAKMRTAIAGIYIYRERYSNAERALMQALELCNDSPDANMRLLDLYLRMERFEDAQRVMSKLDDLKAIKTDMVSERIKTFRTNVMHKNQLEAAMKKDNKGTRPVNTHAAGGPG